MSHRVLVTQAVAGKTARAEGFASPGDAVEGCVVVAAPADLPGWRAASFSEAAWVVLGNGPPPVGGGGPFLRLPATAGEESIEAAIDAALELLRLREELAQQQGETAVARERQLDLVRVGIALTAERDLDRLLQVILTTARELLIADAGSLYLIDEHDGDRVLRFVLAQNDSVPASLATRSLALDSSSLAGYVATSGEVVTVADAHDLPPDLPFCYNPSFDLASGYHTVSVLTAPIATRAEEVIGVLQLINRKSDPTVRILDRDDADRVVQPFGETEVGLIRALAAQAAVAIENTRLVHEIERLFEGFVRAAVVTIEQRDPATCGHSLRVAHYTVSLARALERNAPPTYRGVSFSRDQITQLRYAALLHDFGKVGVREAVLTKGKKLFPERLALIKERFLHAGRAREAALLRRLLGALQTLGRAPGSEDMENLEFAIRQMKNELHANLATVVAVNEPAVQEKPTAPLLARLAQSTFPGVDGAELPLLVPEELRALSIGKGSLDEGERSEIEAHVVHSYQFLLTIPWPRRFAGIPGLAYGHHEKLNGRGYPNRLVADQIPVEVRAMTVSDIYDALTVGDRPYKAAMAPERALALLEADAESGALDADLVRLFIDARIFAQPMTDGPAV
jgi:HD-GYP domain-containing protein (c-di-GMP phosphodiesterase class II)